MAISLKTFSKENSETLEEWKDSTSSNKLLDLKKIEEFLPVKERAYKASGIITLKGFLIMILGVLITIFLLGLEFHLFSIGLKLVINELEERLQLNSLMVSAGGIFFMLIAFGIAVRTSTHTLNIFEALAKNRNRFVFFIFCFLPWLIASLIFFAPELDDIVTLSILSLMMAGSGGMFTIVDRVAIENELFKTPFDETSNQYYQLKASKFIPFQNAFLFYLLIESENYHLIEDYFDKLVIPSSFQGETDRSFQISTYNVEGSNFGYPEAFYRIQAVVGVINGQKQLQPVERMFLSKKIDKASLDMIEAIMNASRRWGSFYR